MRQAMDGIQYYEETEDAFVSMFGGHRSLVGGIAQPRLRADDWRPSVRRVDWCDNGHRISLKVRPIDKIGERDRDSAAARESEISKLAGERLDLVSLKYGGHDTPEVLDRLHSLTARLANLMPPVENEAVLALEDIGTKLEEFSRDIDLLDSLLKG